MMVMTVLQSQFIAPHCLQSHNSVPSQCFSITILVLKSALSQAAACDGNYYQIPQEYEESNPPPGVLPI